MEIINYIIPLCIYNTKYYWKRKLDNDRFKKSLFRKILSKYIILTGVSNIGKLQKSMF